MALDAEESPSPEPSARARPGGVPLSFAERVDWLRLARSERVGPVTFARLIARFEEPAAALAALPGLAANGGGRPPRIAPRETAEAELEALDAAGGVLLTPRDPAYPPRLAAIADPPPVLAVLGDPAVLSRRGVAVVGSRNASIAGKRTARLLAEDFAAAGLAVTSGLARGIDAAAHEAALAGGTIAVMAGGLDRVYPPEHGALAERIVESGGAIASEMPLGWAPRSVDFPRRNRIVSGLSLAVVVVEAARRSGTIHTARAALEQGRDVFAVPGSPRDPRAEGCNALLKEGAGLVTEAGDVLAALATGAAPRGGGLGEREAAEAEWRLAAADEEAGDGAPAADEADRIREALGPAPVDVDDIVRETGVPAGRVQLALLELELAGRLERHAGGAVSLIS